MTTYVPEPDPMLSEAAGRVDVEAKSWFVQQAEARGVRVGTDPGAYDPAYLAAQLPWYNAVFGPGRWFDVEVEGLDHVPDTPSMLVSNHSGGTIVLDGFGFMTAWYRHFGPERPLHGLAHEFLFGEGRFGTYCERCGILRADRTIARTVVETWGRDFLVMPGGDREVWRPARDRYRVRFGGRTGYARTALELGVPLVPVAHVGAHHTLHVLTDGRRLARHVPFIREGFRAEIFPVHLSLPWGLAVGPWPHLPPPTRFDYAVGTPIVPAQKATITDTDVEALDREVRTRVQELLDGLATRRRRRRGVRRRLRDARARLRTARRSVDELRALAAEARRADG